MKLYLSIVEDNIDPEQLYRVRCRVSGVYDTVKLEHIPWARPLSTSISFQDIPAKGSQVYVVFEDDDVHRPLYLSVNDFKLTNELDYQTSAILFSKDLSLYDSDGRIDLTVDKDRLRMSFDKSDKTASIELREDNTIVLENTNLARVLHISNDSISLGSIDKSAQPSVLGDDNATALTKLNDGVQTLTNTLTNGLDTLRTAAASNPYTVALVPAILALSTQLKLDIAKIHSDIELQIPKTKSTVVTLD